MERNGRTQQSHTVESVNVSEVAAGIRLERERNAKKICMQRTRVNAVVSLFHPSYFVHLTIRRTPLPAFVFPPFTLCRFKSSTEFLFQNPAALLPFLLSLYASLDSPLPYSSHPPPPSLSLLLPFYYYSHPHLLIFSRLI